MKPRDKSGPWLWIILFGCLLVVLLAIILSRPERQPGGRVSAGSGETGAAADATSAPAASARQRKLSVPAVAATAEEIVAAKVSQFTRKRRELARRLAREANVTLSDEVERFFDAAEAGRYDEMQTLFDSLLARRRSDQGSEMDPYWRAILEAQGAGESARDWPAQKLLDFGNAVLGSLRPGMVYVGGTDPGCFIPNLMNETGVTEPHIMFTQNALPDRSYLEYLRNLHGDRFNTLTKEEVDRIGEDYKADATKRLLHDQQFPNEPRQVLPGEELKLGEDGNLQFANPIAVMGLSEQLFQAMLKKNPDVSFALEESFPFRSTYAEAVPLGPVMELRVADADTVFTGETATDTVRYWESTAQQLRSDPGLTSDSHTMKTYAKLIASQAHLLEARHFDDQAGQAYRLALQLCPSSPEPVYNYINLLMKKDRKPEAVTIAEGAVRADPGNGQLRDLLQRLRQ